MKVQPVQTNNGKRFIMLDNNYNRIPAVDKFVHYLDAYQKSPGTQRTYLFNLLPYFEYLDAIGLEPLTICEKDDLQYANQVINDFVIFLTNPERAMIAVNGKMPKKHSNNSANRILATVVNFYTTLQNIGYITSSIRFTKKMVTKPGGLYYGMSTDIFYGNRTESNLHKLYPDAKKPIKFITREQFTQVFFAMNNLRDRLIAALLFEGGFRSSEALGMRWEDVEVESNTVKVKFRDDNPNGARAKYCENRNIQVPDYVIDLLCEYEYEFQEKIDSGVDVNHYQILMSIGRKNAFNPMTYDALYRVFTEVSKKVGFYVRAHMLRHGFANDKLLNGFTPEEVKVLLGHKYLSTTMDTYADARALLQSTELCEKLKRTNNYGMGGVRLYGSMPSEEIL